MLILGDASFQSCAFVSLFMDHLLYYAHSGFPSSIKKQLDWLAHQHEVKFASDYLKLTENIFDKKKQKATTTQSFSFCLVYSFAITGPSNFLLMEGVWQTLEKTGRGSNSHLTNNVISLSLGFSIWWWKYLPWKVIMKISSNSYRAFSREPGAQQVLRCVW